VSACLLTYDGIERDFEDEFFLAVSYTCTDSETRSKPKIRNKAENIQAHETLTMTQLKLHHLLDASSAGCIICWMHRAAVSCCFLPNRIVLLVKLLESRRTTLSQPTHAPVPVSVCSWLDDSAHFDHALPTRVVGSEISGNFLHKISRNFQIFLL